MDQSSRGPGALAIVVSGLLALASAMGVGRFAFTPLMPLMQAESGLTLSQGAWLAGSNYAGYLAGAVWCSVAVPPPGRAARLGLTTVTVATLAMAAVDSFWPEMTLRFIAGVASAYVLVGVSAWALAALAELQRARWSGWVFAGVGTGVAVAGLVGLVAGIRGLGAHASWLILGLISGAVTVAAWRPMQGADSARRVQASTAQPVAKPQPLRASDWRLVACYGAFGFGYIIPGTFLPAMARTVVSDPAVFGWVWPAFGVTAALSTIFSSTILHRLPPRTVWVGAQVVMAMGAVAPVLSNSLGGLLVSAVCVGGTFMVATMAGMQEARRVGGANATRLIAAMVSAFATGQIAGPIVVGISAALGGHGIAGPSLLAAGALVVAMWFMTRPQGEQVSATRPS